jgi:hypothetical protein
MCAMRCKLVVCFALLMIGGAVAQSIAPPVAEFRGNKVDGMVEVANNADFPMAIMLETRSFEVDADGGVRYRPLDSDIQLKMGSSSFILRPHDTRFIFYKAIIPTAPASFSIVVSMTQATTVKGVRLNYILPHMIYVYQKDKLEKTDIVAQLRDGILHLENVSQKLGRVAGVNGGKQEVGAFPLYPRQARDIHVDAPKVTVRFEDGFKIDAE